MELKTKEDFDLFQEKLLTPFIELGDSSPKNFIKIIGKNEDWEEDDKYPFGISYINRQMIQSDHFIRDYGEKWKRRLTYQKIKDLFFALVIFENNFVFYELSLYSPAPPSGVFQLLTSFDDFWKSEELRSFSDFFERNICLNEYTPFGSNSDWPYMEIFEWEKPFFEQTLETIYRERSMVAFDLKKFLEVLERVKQNLKYERR